MAHKREPATAIIDPPLRRMTEEEFISWIESNDVRAEWVDGEVIELMPPDERHQLLSWFLSTLIGLFVNMRGLGVLLYAPFGMHLRDQRSYREPDIVVVLAEHRDRRDGKRLIGPADVAIEIVGSESAARDLRDKFQEYAMAGVQEYWIIDPRPGRPVLRAFTSTPEATYVELAPDEQRRVHSRVLPGLWIHPNWLESDPIADPLWALAQIWPEQFGQFTNANR